MYNTFIYCFQIFCNSWVTCYVLVKITFSLYQCVYFWLLSKHNMWLLKFHCKERSRIENKIWNIKGLSLDVKLFGTKLLSLCIKVFRTRFPILHMFGACTLFICMYYNMYIYVWYVCSYVCNDNNMFITDYIIEKLVKQHGKVAISMCYCIL